MRLLQSLLVRLQHTKKPQHKFLTHLLGLFLMVPGHATFRNLSRYRPYHEKTFARWYARGFDVVSLNTAAITAVLPKTHAQALVIDASCVPKSGQHPYGLDRFWNGSPSHTEKGLESSALAWLDVTGTCAYGRSVAHTPPTGEGTDQEATRIAISLAPLPRGVSAHDLGFLRDMVSDGSYSTQTLLRGVQG